MLIRPALPADTPRLLELTAGTGVFKPFVTSRTIPVILRMARWPSGNIEYIPAES